MQLSESAQRSGWQHYPSSQWDRRKPIDWLHDWPFWQHCAERYATGPILELACGNGRITRQLVMAGYDVVAVDINPHFLNRALQHIPATHRSRVNFMLQDVVQLDIHQTFTLIIMADWAFPALLTIADMIAFFGRVTAHLSSNGVFAFNTPLLGATQPTTFDLLTQTETRLSGDHPIRLRHTTFGEIQLLAHIYAFDIIEPYGGTDFRPLRGQPGDDLTLVLRKRS